MSESELDDVAVLGAALGRFLRTRAQRPEPMRPYAFSVVVTFDDGGEVRYLADLQLMPHEPQRAREHYASVTRPDGPLSD